jgi:hypothetical protein
MPIRPARDAHIPMALAMRTTRDARDGIAVDAAHAEAARVTARRARRRVGALLVAACALAPWGASILGPDATGPSASAAEQAVVVGQNVPIQPALAPIRRFELPAEVPPPAAPPFEAVATTEPFLFWLITSDGERRPIRQFAVEGDTLIVWPLRPATTRSAKDAPATDGSAEAVADRSGETERASERMPLASCVAILANRPVRATTVGPRAEPALELVDGQRFPGEPRASAKPFAWAHSWLGTQPIELDRTRSIVLQPTVVSQSSRSPGGTAMLEPGAEDLVLLGNGDRVDGIIGELGADVVVERAGAGATTIPIGRIAALVLISPPEPPIGPRLWFDDGTVIDAVPTSSETAKPGLLAIRRVARTPAPGAGANAPAPTTAERTPLVETFVLRAFATVPSAILPLASVTAHEARPTGSLPTFAHSRPSVVPGQWPARLSPIVIGGATAVRYELPEATGRFVAEMRPDGANPRWTSFTVVVRSGDREVFRRDVAPDPSTGALPRDPVWINVPITSRVLEIEVLEGERGPICDGVRLDYAMLMRPTKTGPADGAAPRG